MLQPFFHGFILALGLILPLGVQNVFIFNQGALQRKYVRALPAVLTACLCDTLLILLSVFGVSMIILDLEWIKLLLIAVGSVFLLYMGWMTWKTKPQKQGEENGTTFSSKKQILFAASVSLLNPHAILDTVGVIGTSSLSYDGQEKAIFVLACIFVSWVWFIGLSLTGRLSGKLDQSGKFMFLLNKLSAVIMWVAALFLITSLLDL